MGNAESTSQSGHESVPAATSSDAPDEPWWQQIEHENLILQQVQEQQLQPVQAMDTSPKTEPTDAAAAAEEVKPESDGSSLEEFREQLASKRLARQTAVQEMREELTKLREQLAQEKAENQRLRRQTPSEPVEAGAAASASVVAQESQPDPDDENPSSRSRHANIELANAQLALQLANADNLSLRSELDVVQRQVGTLKEVICCCKQMLSVKEEQCAQLKMKLQEIENSFSEREMKIMSNNLRQEYERQLVNIRQLRQLYEERQRVAAAEYENLQRLISIKKDELIAEQEKTKSCEERNQLLLKELETANDELAKVREECAEHKYEKRALKEQVGAVNLLFSQLVMGFNGKNNLNIDRLTQMLEENRDLLNEMTQAEGSCSDGATLPKLLFELVEQAAKSGDVEPDSDKSRSATPTPNTESEVKAMGEDITDSVKPEPSVKKHRRRSAGGAGGAGVTAAAASLKSHEPEIMGKVATAQEIIGNLPKVWKVLMELLSHHKIERVQFEEQPAAVEDGHKAAPTAAPTRGVTAAAVVGGGGGSVTTTTTTAATATGKAPELSVSKTYIKLKDLIMEKKSLVKETNRLKTLNCHLDNRLNEQEKRLSAVSLELTKTWHLVGKMQRQHRQLHTQEQILRYQLQQKRRLLSELKDELEYCRRKWAAARAKNDESQEQCNDWRREFARRKLEDANHSAESGYSDSGPQSDEDTAAAAAAAAGAVAAVADEASAAAAAVAVAVAGDGAPRRKHLRDQFEHTRKIKRMQSTSPGRQAAAAAGLEAEDEEIVLRWNSAPPTCGWRETETEEDEEEQEQEQQQQQQLQRDVASTSRGAVARTAHSSRSRQRGKLQATAGNSPHSSAADAGTASRIQKLEQQCQSLIQQVLETSGNRERLEVQLCRFQDEIAPVQHAVPLDEFINRKRLERMTRASSAPATGGGSLTPREEEYTRKRSERLGRLEEESRQLLSRIKRTTDRGHYLKKSLDRIRRAPSREASFESNTEEEPKEEPAAEAESPLTAEEQASIDRRAARLQRLEHESQQLIAQLSRNTERGEGLANRLDTLHERYDSQDQTQAQGQTQAETQTAASLSLTVEQRLEDIERVSANRAERLRRLEQQGDELIARLSNTSERGTAMINRIAQREASRKQEAELLEQTLPVGQQVSSNSISSSSSTNIVEETSGAACSATVTTTASQLALRQSTGAIPKTPSARSRPQAQLCAAARHEDAHKKRSKADKAETGTETKAETLEDMVLRLRSLPYPTAGQGEDEEKVDEMLEKREEQMGASELEKQECDKQEKLEQTESELEEKQADDNMAEFEKLQTQDPEQ
ncbi:trichohyalin [Drosophila navojoa]|uniref:trichohyalin n=1 Tax=Drosophila navojoa TaxID=7232 RepID=UPI0011BDEC34|nr:trichohyalin [Drosophila navojoa]